MITIQQISKEIKPNQIAQTILNEMMNPEKVRLVLFDKNMVIHVAEFRTEGSILKSGRLSAPLAKQIKDDLEEATRFTLEEIA